MNVLIDWKEPIRLTQKPGWNCSKQFFFRITKKCKQLNQSMEYQELHLYKNFSAIKGKSLIDACHNMGESQMLYSKWKAEHTRPCGV